MLADDPAAIVDIPHFCNEAGHELAEQSDENGVQTYLIRKG
ncbi:MAG: sulfurtransferase TusA family protein [Pseudomonadota bacterium]